MNSTIKYTNASTEIEESLDSAVVTADFLPSPKLLSRKAEKEKITIAIDKHSLDLFKQYALKHNTKYQPMINNVLGSYAKKFLHM
jgi:predicted DNA binding CopG/RHH family protein